MGSYPPRVSKAGILTVTGAPFDTITKVSRLGIFFAQGFEEICSVLCETCSFTQQTKEEAVWRMLLEDTTIRARGYCSILYQRLS